MWSLIDLPSVAKGYNHQEGIDFKENFSPVSNNDSRRIIMAIVAHFNLELHQMDVKTTFLNGDLVKGVYMSQPIVFKEVSKEHMVCKLQKSIYGLKQTSKHWYLKFDEVVTVNGIKEKIVDQCIYMKISGENTYSWFFMLMIFCSQPMRLTCWLRQRNYCLAILI